MHWPNVINVHYLHALAQCYECSLPSCTGPMLWMFTTFMHWPNVMNVHYLHALAQCYECSLPSCTGPTSLWGLFHALAQCYECSLAWMHCDGYCFTCPINEHALTWILTWIFTSNVGSLAHVHLPMFTCPCYGCSLAHVHLPMLWMFTCPCSPAHACYGCSLAPLLWMFTCMPMLWMFTCPCYGCSFSC